MASAVDERDAAPGEQAPQCFGRAHEGRIVTFAGAAENADAFELARPSDNAHSCQTSLAAGRVRATQAATLARCHCASACRRRGAGTASPLATKRMSASARSRSAMDHVAKSWAR